MKAIVGLGNPGWKYSLSRHNVGFLILDELADRLQVGLSTRQGAACTGWTEYRGEEILLAKPQTYMNLSGKSARALADLYGLTARDFVFIYDDMDLEVGRIRVRGRGSAGGHRGLASVLAALGEESFFRIKVGIGRPPEGVDPVEYVLFPFAKEERQIISRVIPRAAEAALALTCLPLEEVMQKYNSAAII